MPEFAYIARDTHGQKVTGTVAAGSEREAIAQLSGQALFPLEVTTETAKQPTAVFRGRISGQLIATTYSQLAALLRSW